MVEMEEEVEDSIGEKEECLKRAVEVDGRVVGEQGCAKVDKPISHPISSFLISNFL